MNVIPGSTTQQLWFHDVEGNGIEGEAIGMTTQDAHDSETPSTCPADLIQNPIVIPHTTAVYRPPAEDS
jgi:hypothetical protein